VIALRVALHQCVDLCELLPFIACTCERYIRISAKLRYISAWISCAQTKYTYGGEHDPTHLDLLLVFTAIFSIITVVSSIASIQDRSTSDDNQATSHEAIDALLSFFPHPAISAASLSACRMRIHLRCRVISFKRICDIAYRTVIQQRHQTTPETTCKE